MRELNIDLICANTPATKGRVERAPLTLQDRLVKERRLAGVSSMDDGNLFLKVAGSHPDKGETSAGDVIPYSPNC